MPHRHIECRKGKIILAGGPNLINREAGWADRRGRPGPEHRCSAMAACPDRRGAPAARYSIRPQVCVLQMNHTQPLTLSVFASTSSISAS